MQDECVPESPMRKNESRQDHRLPLATIAEPTLPLPIESNSWAMPGDDGLGFDDEQCRSPSSTPARAKRTGSGQPNGVTIDGHRGQVVGPRADGGDRRLQSKVSSKTISQEEFWIKLKD